jgi:hypothetical protein
MESEEPTNKQLANFACVMTYGSIIPSYRDLIEAMLNESSVMRDQWLRNHADFQERLGEIAKEDHNVRGLQRRDNN